MNILYAEDDPVSGRLVKKIAESEGYSVTVAPTGEEFLRILSKDKPDLILLDLELPDASGLDLLDLAPRTREPFAFAGLWNCWRDRELESELDIFTVITARPNEE